MTSLEKAITHYVNQLADHVNVRLRVSGDENWASPVVIDETYLILREAVRNAVRHGMPQLILIGVHVSPHELHAWVEDDGQGFAVPACPQGASYSTAWPGLDA